MRLASPFLLRSVTPPLDAAAGRRVVDIRRLGKRIAIGLEGRLFLVLHLMIAGRLRWRDRAPGSPAPELARKVGLAAFDFGHGSVLLTEAGTRKRASLHVVDEGDLAQHDPGGLDVLRATVDAFADAMMRENHTLKRALTDPHVLSGVGNAYSDEILHRAKLSPMKQTRGLDRAELERLHRASGDVLREWIDRLRRETGDGFPDKVTAFREGMAVHGRFGQPCPVCGSPVQRIVYAENEANYCAACQTGGRLLADRAMSRLLKSDWPKTLEEAERVRERRRQHG